MSAYIVILDPSAAISGRTELNLNSGAIAVGGPSSGTGIDWGESQIKSYLAEQRIGEAVVDYRIPNRVVSIPLVVGANANGTVAEEEEARRKLNEKVALFQRQGGVLMRQREGAAPLYADIVEAGLTLPDVWGGSGGVEPNVVLKLVTLPDWYGEEVTLDAVEQTGQVVQVLQQGGKQAVIAGDYPARTRIVLTEKSKHDQLGMLWGLRSTHYDSASTAALFFDAALLTPINGAKAVADSNAYSGKTIELAEPEVEVWHPFLSTDVLSGAKPLTHVGSYRVWARISGWFEHRFRLAWSLDDAIAPTYNAAVRVGGNGYSIFDLGEIRISQPPVGEHWWRGILQVNNSGAVSRNCVVDRIWLQPVDDGAGRLRATGRPTSTLLGPTRRPGEAASAGEGVAWTNPDGARKSGEHAEASLSVGEPSKLLALKKPGFTIPEATTVKGIVVYFGFSTGAGGYFLSQATLYKAGALVGGTKTQEGEGGLVFGGSSDLWGTTWTPAQINAAGFGVGLAAQSTITPKWTAYISSVQIEVYYSYSSGAIVEDAVLYSERQSEIRFDGAFREDTTTGAYVGISQAVGDLPRLPPSGLEGRAVELFAKNSRGDLTPAKADSGIDAISAVVKIRPCYLGRI